MSMRLNIPVSDEVNEKLNALSKKWGVTKSSLCAIAIGQYIDGVDEAFKLINTYAHDLVNEKKAEELKIRN